MTDQTSLPERLPLLDVPVSDWPELLKSIGEEGYRAGQLAEWVFKKRADRFSAMTNLPSTLRRKLEEGYELHSLEIDRAVTSPADGTTRYYFKTRDGLIFSSVFLPFEDRASLCLSTQVGCAWGCVFCASGQVALQRNLTAGEIIDQILLVEKAAERGLDSLLFMGMGEPLANYASLVSALQVIRSGLCLGFGARHVTVSTCGLAPQIEKMAHESPKVNLAISLHAAFDELRKSLLPKSSRWSIKELLEATKLYSKVTKARVTFEYIVLAGINDSERDAKRLANLLRNMAKHGDYWVNLIAYNPVAGLPYKRPEPETIEMFKDILTKRGVPVRLRKPQGVDIDAGCGQLGEAVYG